MKTVCVLFGGTNSEHKVSLRSAASVLANIDRQKWDVIMLGITQDGKWLRFSGDPELLPNGRWETDSNNIRAVLSPDREHHGLLEHHPDGIRLTHVDIVFPVMHGKYAEDGTIQGLCAVAGIPCVGSGVLASAVCMDKAVAHVLLEQAGIPRTKLVCVQKQELSAFSALEQRLAAELSYPMFVKPANAGSSVGVSKAKDAESLLAALEAAFCHDRKVVVEQAVVGQEVEVAVMGNDNPVASAVLGEIAPAAEFYDYDAKYNDNSTGLYVPARIPDDVAQRIRETALRAYTLLDCRGLCRIDFFVRPDGSIVLNEPNTLPGFTSISMYPRLFQESGVTYPALIDSLLAYAEEDV